MSQPHARVIFSPARRNINTHHSAAVSAFASPSSGVIDKHTKREGEGERDLDETEEDWAATYMDERKIDRNDEPPGGGGSGG